MLQVVISNVSHTCIKHIPRLSRVIFLCRVEWLNKIGLGGATATNSRVMRDDPRASLGKYPRLAIKTARDSCEVHARRTQNPCEFLVFLP